MGDQTVGISLLGCGVVGTGVARILFEDREMIRRRTGLNFDIRHIVVRDTNKERRSFPTPLTTDPQAAINDPQTQIVVELIGGTGVAANLVEAALRKGKHVVTANKSLLATKGPELFALARA